MRRDRGCYLNLGVQRQGLCIRCPPSPPQVVIVPRCTSRRGGQTEGRTGLVESREERASSSNSGAAAAGSAACERLVGSAEWPDSSEGSSEQGIL